MPSLRASFRDSLLSPYGSRKPAVPSGGLAPVQEAVPKGGPWPPLARTGLLGAAIRLYRRKKRVLFLLVVVLELTYLFLSVPLRIGFLFDPYAQQSWLGGWTLELSVLTALDLLADVAGLVSLREIFVARRREQASIAADASNVMGIQRRRKVPGGARLEKRASILSRVRDSLMVSWSLNTIIPMGHLKQNIRGPLLLELLSMVPLELLALAFGPNSLHLLRALKLLRLYRVPGCVREIKTMYAGAPSVQVLEYTGNAMLLNTVMIGFAMCHWLACTYMAIAHLECGIDFKLCSKALVISSMVPGPGPGGTNLKVSPTGSGSGYTCWAIEDYLVDTSLARQYARAAYWASRSVVTVGFYDVAAVTNIETAYVIVVQVVGAIFSTAVLATFLFIFRYRNARMQEFMTHVDNAKEYMQMRHFPETVREGVLGYYKNAWATHHALYHGEVVERLPEHLRVSVYSVLKVQRIQNVAFLAKESVEFINTLALHIEHCVYSPKDWVIEKSPDGMYFVLRGQVLLDGPRHPQPKFAKPGDHFAELCLLTPGKSDERARAQTYCDLYKLPQQAFYNTLTIFYRESTSNHLESMREMNLRRDQQEQKMKRMLGSSAENFTMTSSNLGSSSRYNSSQSMGRLGEMHTHHTHQRPHWRMPGSTFRKWWEHVRLVALIFVAFEVPFFIVFDTATFPFGLQTKYSMQSIISVLVEAFFVADFVFRCRYFAYIDQLAMIPVNDPSYIFDAYRENGLWPDLLAILPVSLVDEFAFVHGDGSPSWMPIFRLARLLRIRYLQQTIQEIAHIRGTSSKVLAAWTMLLYVTLVIHMTGCLWFLMARMSVTESDFEPLHHGLTRDQCLYDAGHFGNCSWVLYDAYGQIGTLFKVQDIERSKYSDKLAYLRSIYWAIVSLTTVGYGDIVAFSTSESFFAALWVFVGGIINYGVMGAMSNIITNLTANSRHHSEKMNTINQVMAHFRISEGVRSRIRQYYHQQLYVQKVTSEAQLLAGLPSKLRHNISLILHADSVRKVPLFVDAANERLLYELTGLFRRQLFQRGDVLFAENSVCEEMYVLVSGRANIFSKRVGSVPVGALSAGDCFGVCELLLQKSVVTTVIAASVVDVSVITHSAFVSTIERRFPAEVNTLRMRAMQQHIFDVLSLEAVIDNIKTRSTVAKFTEDCTSMFVEKDNWARQRKKMRLRLSWDLVMLLLDISNAFLVTFRIGFLAHPAASTRLVFIVSDAVKDLLLLLDIYLKLYYFECEGVGLGNLLTREERDATYVARGLRGDLLSSLPLYYVGENFLAMSLCRLPRLLRLRQVPDAIDSLIMRLQQRFSSGDNISAYLSPIKLVLILVFTGHLAACVFYLICFTDNNPKSWIHTDPVVKKENGSIEVLYLRAFYWALTTLTLVGSKDVVPLGVGGTIWATLTCLCCTFIVGHIVGELSELILEMDKTKKQLKERETRFDQFAKDHNLPSNIRTRVLHYLKFQHSYIKGMDIYSTFSDLSPNLRVQLMMDLHGATLQKLCIAPFLGQTHIHGLAVRLKSELFIPGDTIIVEGDLGHKLYIVKGGTGMVLWKSTGTAVATLTAGSLFGEVAFFLRGQRRIASVQATTCSEVLVLGRQGWEDLLASSHREEAEATERALVRWVHDCLKGYNVMTVEIVKDIKSGGEVGGSHTSTPPNIDELRELNATARSVSVISAFERDAANAREERKVRHLLKKQASGGMGSRSEAPEKPPLLVALWRWLSHMALPGQRSGMNVNRIYAERPSSAEAEEVANDGQAAILARDTDTKRHSETAATPTRTLRHEKSRFPWRGQQQASDQRTLPMLKANSLKSGMALQINPVSSSMREHYCDEQLAEMEEECWRRYKVSLLMAEALPGHASGSDAVLLAASPVSPASPATPQQSQASTQQPLRAILTSGRDGKGDDDVPTSSRGRGIRVARKTFCGAMLPGASPQKATRTSVTTDGMRFLANYETRTSGSDIGRKKQRGSTGLHIAGERHRSFSKPNLSSSGMMHHHRRRRKLKRSQSLPLFDRHFVHMLQEELQESNSKDYESKLNLGFELLQRCRQPEFSFLFQLYLSGLKHRRRLRRWCRQIWERFARIVRYTPSDSSHDVTPRVRPRLASSMRDLLALESEARAQQTSPASSNSLLQATAAGEEPGAAVTKAEEFLNLLVRYYRLWECIVVLVGMFYAVTLPFFLCFASNRTTRTEDEWEGVALANWVGVLILIDILCLVDLALKRSAFQGVLRLTTGGGTDIPTGTRSSASSTARASFSASSQQQRPSLTSWWCGWHVNTRLWQEVSAALPLDLLLFLPPLSQSSLADYRWYYLALFQINKLPRIAQSVEASERLAQFLSADLSLPFDDSALRFVRSVCGYLLSGHWIACVWYRAGLIAYQFYGYSWLSTAKMLPVDGFHVLSEVPTLRRYLRALHFAIGSITTVFYGDIAGMNVAETSVELTFIVVCILLFGVLVGAQGERIEAHYKHKMLFEQHLTELYHFLCSNEVPRDVRQRLRLYYTNTWLKYHGHDDLEGVRGLSTLLVEDIAQYTLRDFAAKVSILKSCDECFLRSLLTCLKHVICSSSEAVVRKGDVDRSMYFIARGKVLVKGLGFELVKEEGDFFGELSLLYGIPRSATCSSLGVSLLYVLEWETYERLLADYPEYREQNRREWVVVSTVLQTGESRFRSIINIVAGMEKANWVLVDDIIRKAKSLK